MKHIKYYAVSVMLCLTFLMPLTACGSNPVDDAFDTVEGMASQEDKAQDALDDFKESENETDAQAQEILDMVE